MERHLALVQSDVEAVLADGRADRLDKLHGEHIFISGGTGFLGIWLLELIKGLNERHGFGIRVTVYARHAREFAAEHPHLGAMKGARYEDGDIRHLAGLPRDVRYIIHAAALTDRRLLSSQPMAVAETNAVGAQRLLRAAMLLEEVEKVVMLSSGLVYGEQPWSLPQIDENYAGRLRSNAVGSVYAESKRFAEAVAFGAISESKLPVVVLRPFAFVGPYQSLELPWAVTDFIRDSFNGGPIRIMGDGATVRSLMYASDFSYWVLAALAIGRSREVYNVGSPEAVDLATLALMITQLFSPAPEIRTCVGQSGFERNRLVPDIGHAARTLGVKVTVPLAVAIQRAITWNRFLLSR